MKDAAIAAPNAPNGLSLMLLKTSVAIIALKLAFKLSLSEGKSTYSDKVSASRLGKYQTVSVWLVSGDTLLLEETVKGDFRLTRIKKDKKGKSKVEYTDYKVKPDMFEELIMREITEA